MKKIDLKREKIRYVAIGDSISEGYNGRYNFGYAGNMDDKKNISGTSWPSFLARNLLKIDKNCLESYENFALSGTRPEDWNYFLRHSDVEKYNYKNSAKKIDFAIYLNEIKTNPERKRVKKQFKNFGKDNPKDFDYLIEKIENANLITINIGANFLLPKIPVDEITRLVLEDKTEPNKIIKKIKKIITEAEEDINIMLERIKELNNDALIYLIGYNKLHTPFWELVDNFFKKINLHECLTVFLCDKLNQSLKKCAKKTNTYFISTNNKIFWEENSYMLSNIFYEIHPTIFGYKKIAQDVLAKIALPDSFFENGKKVDSKIPTFNKRYVLEDKNCFKNGIDFSKVEINEEIIIEKIFGKNNEILFSKSTVEISAGFLETSLFFEQALDRSNDPDETLSFSFKKSFFTLLNSLEINIDKKLSNDIKKLIKIDFFNVFLKQTNLVSTIANKIQTKIDDYFFINSKNVSVEKFIDIIFDEVIDFKFLGWIMKEFAQFWSNDQNLEFYKNKKTITKILTELFRRKKIVNMSRAFISEWIKYSLWKRVDLDVSINNIREYVDAISSKINVNQFINVLIDFYFSSTEKIKRINTFDEFLNLFFNDKNVINFLNKNIKNVLSTIKVDDIFCLRVMNRLNIENNKNNFKIMKSFFNNILSISKKDDFFLEVFSKLVIHFVVNKDEKINLQNIINFLFSLDKKDFWHKMSKIDFSKMDKKIFDNLILALELVFNNLKINGLIFSNIIKLSNPKNFINENNKKIKTINFIKYIDKLSYFKNPLEQFLNILISNFYTSKTKIKDDYNYKAYFRTISISLLILRQLFQKNVDRDVFMGGKISITKFVFQIAGFKNGKNKGMDNLILNMFNEEGNYLLKPTQNPKDKENNLLWLIGNFDKNKKNESQYIKRIFEIIKNGYIDNDLDFKL